MRIYRMRGGLYGTSVAGRVTLGGASPGRRAPRRRVCADDPARVFWGPPDKTGNYRLWSRAWFEWR
jgi:hypothetical protein